MAEFEHVVILVTVDGPETGEEIAEALLGQQKAACVNIVPGVKSLFLWQGEPDSADESLLIIKTAASLVDDVVGIVRANHPYDVPEVIALPVVGGNQDYLKWIDSETGGV